MSENEHLAKLAEQQSAPAANATEANPLVSATAELVEGKVSEVAPNIQAKASGQNSNQKKAQKKQDDTQLPEREILRNKLLAQAPKERVMKAEVKKVLRKERDKLEASIENYRKKKQYHLLSAAIMRMRVVMKELASLARASAKQVKTMWLKVVHKFA
ncbi:MAG: putative RNase H-like nuclease [Oceanicoccus sp.]|jgi:predicted RNase H-like nuclease